MVVKSSLEIALENADRLSDEADEERRKIDEEKKFLKSRDDEESLLRLAEIYYKDNDWTAAVQILEKLPAVYSRDLMQGIAEQARRQIDHTCSLFLKGDFDNFESKSKELLGKLRCDLIYFLAGLSLEVQGKEDPFYVQCETADKVDLGITPTDYIDGVVQGLQDIQKEARFGSEEPMKGRKRIYESLNFPVVLEALKRYDNSNDHLVILRAKYALISKDFDEVLGLGKDYLPDDEELELLKAYGSYKDRKFGYLTRYAEAGMLRFLPVALVSKGRYKIAKMVYDNLVTANRDIFHELNLDTQNIVLRDKAKTDFIVGDYQGFLESCINIDDILVKSDLVEMFVSEASGHGDLQALLYMHNEFQKAASEIDRVCGSDQGIRAYFDHKIGQIHLAAKKQILKTDDWRDIIEIEKMQDESTVPIAKDKRSAIDYLAGIRAHHLLNLRVDPKVIMQEIEQAAPGSISSFAVSDEGITEMVNSSGLRHVRWPVYNRKVSQDVYMFETLVGREELDDQVGLAKFREERVENSLEAAKDIFDSTEMPKDILSRALSQTAYGTTAIYIQGFKIGKQHRFIIKKAFDDEASFKTELAVLESLQPNPVIQVPRMVEYFGDRGRFVLSSSYLPGIELGEYIYATGDKDLLDKHLLDCAYIVSAKNLLSGTYGDEDYTVEPAAKVYGLEDILSGYGLSAGLDDELNSWEQIPYRDASLFNSYVYVRWFADEIDEIMKLQREGRETDKISRIRDLMEETDVKREDLYQMDFASMVKTAFPLEDFLLAVDNPFVHPTEDELHAYLETYLHYLDELGGVEVDDPERQLIVGGFYRQFKNFYYLDTGHLDYGDKQDEFRAYYLERAAHYLRKMDGACESLIAMEWLIQR